MNLDNLLSPNLLSLSFVLIFFILILAFALGGRKPSRWTMRPITAFSRLARTIGLAVESGSRLHLSLGWGGVFGQRGMAGLVGLRVLERIARLAAVSDRPPIASSGNGELAILSGDIVQGAGQNRLSSAQMTGVTQFSYAAGVLPILEDEGVSAQALMGSLGPEAALIAASGERLGALTIAGSDSLPGQAVLYAAAEEPLIGEEFYAAGAYLGAGTLHTASLRAQDILRWLLVLVILVGAVLKLIRVI